MAAIEFKGVTKRFPDGTVAVDDISLDVPDGEFMILVGPSGCGKTTALRMVAGLEEITSGEVVIGGRVVNELEPKERDVAMVFQNYALYPHMTVRDNIAFPLKMQKIPKTESTQRVSRPRRLLGLDELLRRKPRELSGGQRQRVAMGRAIVRHPQAFLMDEPLSNLDAKLRVQMRAELVKLHRRLGVTTLYVTHDQTEAMTLGQRVAVLEAGRHPAGRRAAAPLPPPGEHVRRGLHRLAADELRPGTLADGVLDVGAYRFELPESVRAALRTKEGAVMAGLRPEHFQDAGLAHASGATGPADVEITEQLGPETYAYFRIPGLEAAEIGERPIELAGAFAARLDPRSDAAPGRAWTLAVDLTDVQLFDPESGDSIIGD